MRFIFSFHAFNRMGQRGISVEEVKHIVTYPSQLKRARDGLLEATGIIHNRPISVIFQERERYKKIVTVY